jgi:hypothetical protein
METRIDSQTGEATQYRTASRSVAEQYNQDRSARKEESGQNIIERIQVCCQLQWQMVVIVLVCVSSNVHTN